jgi:tRNA pseudouridine38-40 synthase
MPRYFIELTYKGTNYSGFQIQENAATVQAEVEKAFRVLHRDPVSLTGSSRTDTGVHALQNYFHFDYEEQIHPHFVYKMNAILPRDIALKNIYRMPPEAHSRFDALSREYIYRVHRFKNPFLQDSSYFFPYKLDLESMQEAAALVTGQTEFFAFSKTNTQVRNFNCIVRSSRWIVKEDHLSYHVEANRFLRGMVRLLTGSMLKVGRHKISVEAFHGLFQGGVKCAYSVPPRGLFLARVRYPENYFPAPGLDLTAF